MFVLPETFTQTQMSATEQLLQQAVPNAGVGSLLGVDQEKLGLALQAYDDYFNKQPERQSILLDPTQVPVVGGAITSPESQPLTPQIQPQPINQFPAFNMSSQQPLMESLPNAMQPVIEQQLSTAANSLQQGIGQLLQKTLGGASTKQKQGNISSLTSLAKNPIKNFLTSGVF